MGEAKVSPILSPKEKKIMSRLVAVTARKSSQLLAETSYRQSPRRRIVDITIVREYRTKTDWEAIVFFCTTLGLFGVLSAMTILLESHR